MGGYFKERVNILHHSHIFCQRRTVVATLIRVTRACHLWLTGATVCYCLTGSNLPWYYVLAVLT